MANQRRISRRRALAATAAAIALPLVHIRTAGAAGKLSLAFNDHWVPGANDVMRRLVAAWSDKTKTEVELDFITTVGNKLLLTAAAESQARTGHDVINFYAWEAQNHAAVLEPMDDVLGRLTAKYGPIPKTEAYLAKADGAFRAVPATPSSQNKPCCSRIDLFRRFVGMDVQAVFPVADQMGPGYDQWTWDAFLVAAEKCATAGFPFGMPMGQTPDAVDWVGALFYSHGANLVDAEGNVTVRSDAVRQVLDYARRMMPLFPEDVYSWDDASNNRALISGKSALIMNPPSAWAVAVRDNRPVGEQCWTHPSPAGPKGRFNPHVPFFYGVWSFSRNKSAGKELIEFLSEREQAEALCTASQGYDLPPFQSMTDFAVWRDVGPPKGTVFNYPARPQHHVEPHIAAYPAPPDIGVQIYNQATMTKMIAKVAQSGMPTEQVISWAEQELAGFVR